MEKLLVKQNTIKMKGNNTDMNRWKQYYDFLKNRDQEKNRGLQDKICDVIGCNRTSFYRKMAAPQQLSIAEKTAIANIYELPISWLFPEMEELLANAG